MSDNRLSVHKVFYPFLNQKLLFLKAILVGGMVAFNPGSLILIHVTICFDMCDGVN